MNAEPRMHYNFDIELKDSGKARPEEETCFDQFGFAILAEEWNG